MKRKKIQRVVLVVLFIGTVIFGFTGCTLQAASQFAATDQIILMRLNCTKALKGSNEIAVDPKTPSVSPFTLEGKTMLPVRFIENLGAEVNYDEATMNTTVKFSGIELYLELGNKSMRKTVGGKVSSVNLPTPSSLVEGKTYVPVREIAEGLGFSVNYDGGAYVIVVSEKPLSNSELADQVNAAVQKLPSKVLGVKAITVKNPSRSLNVGATAQLSVNDITFDPQDPGCIRLRYVSDNSKIATVTSQGRVVGRADGTAVITIKSHNGKETMITFKVGTGVRDVTKTLKSPINEDASGDIYLGMDISLFKKLLDDAGEPYEFKHSPDESFVTIRNYMYIFNISNQLITVELRDGTPNGETTGRGIKETV